MSNNPLPIVPVSNKNPQAAGITATGQATSTTNSGMTDEEKQELELEQEYIRSKQIDFQTAQKLGLRIPDGIDPHLEPLWRSYLQTLMVGYYEGVVLEKDVPEFLRIFTQKPDDQKALYLNKFGNLIRDQIEKANFTNKLLEYQENFEQYAKMTALMPEELQTEYATFVDKLYFNQEISEQEYQEFEQKLENWAATMVESAKDMGIINNNINQNTPNNPNNINQNTTLNMPNAQQPQEETGKKVLTAEDLSNYLES